MVQHANTIDLNYLNGSDIARLALNDGSGAGRRDASTMMSIGAG